MSSIKDTVKDISEETLSSLTDYILFRSEITEVQNIIRNITKDSELNFINYPSLSAENRKTILDNINREREELTKDKLAIFKNIVDMPSSYSTSSVAIYNELSSMVQNQKTGIIIFNQLFNEIINELTNNFGTKEKKVQVFYEIILDFLQTNCIKNKIISNYIVSEDITLLFKIWKSVYNGNVALDEVEYQKKAYVKENKQWNYLWNHNYTVQKDYIGYINGLTAINKETDNELDWDKIENNFSLYNFQSIVQLNDDFLYNGIMQRNIEINKLLISADKLLNIIKSFDMEKESIKLTSFIVDLLEDLSDSITVTNHVVKFNFFYIKSIYDLHRRILRLKRIKLEETFLQI